MSLSNAPAPEEIELAMEANRKAYEEISIKLLEALAELKEIRQHRIGLIQKSLIDMFVSVEDDLIEKTEKLKKEQTVRKFLAGEEDV